MTPAMKLHAAFERLEAEHGENIPVGLAYAEALKAIRETRKEAYEKAAQTIQAQCDEKGTGCLAHCTHPESAKAVRALADSISTEGEK